MSKQSPCAERWANEFIWSVFSDMVLPNMVHFHFTRWWHFLQSLFGHMEVKVLDKQYILPFFYLVSLPLVFEAISLLKQIDSRDHPEDLWLALIAPCVLTAQHSVNLCWSCATLSNTSLSLLKVYFPGDSADCPYEDLQKKTVQRKDPFR